MCAAVLHARREHLGGCLPDRSASGRRWRLRGHADLLHRLSRRRLVAWALVTAALSWLFGAMAGDLTDLLEPGSPTSSTVDRMVTGGPVEQFMSLLTVMSMLLVAIAVVQRVNALAGDERAGLVELEVGLGVPRTRLFVAQACAAAVEAAALTLLAGGVLAAATAAGPTDDHAVGRAFVFAVSQLPGVLAAIGIALALVGLAPRLSALTWAVIGWSAFAQLFGGLVELPDRAREPGVLGHHLDVVGDPDWAPLAVQAAVGLAGALVGLVAHRRRDLGR